VATPFVELRERLLRAGLAPRHVRRYLAELTDHLADLTAEEKRAGLSDAAAQSAALLRIGGMDDLARAMIGQRQFRSWCARAPWAVFCVAPLSLLAGAYAVAGLILWSGWKLFLPAADTPFVRLHGLAILYFGVGKLVYFGAPILLGWGIGLIAARQRFKPIWPCIGLVLIALIGGAGQVHTSRPLAPGGGGNIGMDFALQPTVHSLVNLCIVLLPYVIWRLLAARSVSA
jgi:hypothetical protein